MHNADISLESITKVEGHASLDLRIRDGKVEHVHYQIQEAKRFYTQAIEGKPLVAIPALLSRICGTCSNAHQICAIEACEAAIGLKPSEQTMLLRHLTMYGLNIRDHALHLYLFALPDIYGKDNFLAFDENNEEEHQHLHDAFAIKAAGNYLAQIIAGRSVHATYPAIGGFTHFPGQVEVDEAIKKLNEVRPAALRCIETFSRAPFHLDRQTNYMALVPAGNYWFIDGDIVTSQGERYNEKRFRELLEHVVLPYSTASAYTQDDGETYMVGALARLNVAKDTLHNETKKSLGATLDIFPSTDIFHNNLAQAIEILHSLDHAVELLQTKKIIPEPPVKPEMKEGEGIGVVEAPRGTLYHKIHVGQDGIVKHGEVIVPTGQNQVNIEKDIIVLVNRLLSEGAEQEKIEHEIEKLIRAYDPCMSCATHFLKVNWDKV
ncbi:nickel-dependent hydrogenase large subunit [Patescibacteria group bacterium]|nr:nickel-dependent hydrogenase large subunit [Patescibacteria group bacterium]MBU1028792.1 nickel-dependent hydrogenase large subunit [Patescibacteria group bacterium]